MTVGIVRCGKVLGLHPIAQPKVSLRRESGDETRIKVVIMT